MLTDGNAVTLQSMPHTEGYSDYFSQSGTHLSCSFLDKLPNPERKKNIYAPWPGTKRRKVQQNNRKMLFDSKGKRDEVKGPWQTDCTKYYME